MRPTDSAAFSQSPASSTSALEECRQSDGYRPDRPALPPCAEYRGREDRVEVSARRGWRRPSPRPRHRRQIIFADARTAASRRWIAMESPSGIETNVRMKAPQ